jgi:hypothetical protein
MRNERWMKLEELRQPGMRRVLEALRGLDRLPAPSETPECFVIDAAAMDAARADERRVS